MIIHHQLQAVVARELRKTLRNQSELVQALMFFVLAVMLFPFAVGPDAGLLKAIAGGILWLAALLASSFSLDGLFRDDYADGSLELMVVSGTPLAALGLGKALAHWLSTGVPVVVLAVPLAVMLGLGAPVIVVLTLSLTLGTLAMSLLGSAVGALTVGLRNSGMLVAMLILPLYIPLLIFGASATANVGLGLDATAELYFLAGLAVLALSLAPWATAAALKIRMS